MTTSGTEKVFGSSSGTSWSQITDTFGNANEFIVYNIWGQNFLLHVVNSGGRYKTSLDFSNYYSFSGITNLNQNLRDIAFADNKIVVVGNSGQIGLSQ